MLPEPNVKYQVFISSTFDDLRDERQAVTWAFLKLRHIPVGMENLSASTDRGWETIRDLIDNTDYYVIIVAGRYGSVDPATGKSWTEMEYEYARGCGVPVLAFIRRMESIPVSKFDRASADKLEAFVATITGDKGHLAEWWDEREDLVSAATAALSNHIRDDERRKRRRPGWWRGGTFVTPTVPSASRASSTSMLGFGSVLTKHGAMPEDVSRFNEASALFQRGTKVSRNQCEVDIQGFANDLPYNALLALNDAALSKYDRVCAAIAVSFHSNADADGLHAVLESLSWAQGESTAIIYKVLGSIRRLLNHGISIPDWTPFMATITSLTGSANKDVSQAAKAIIQRLSV
jgi:hypothetical protein